MNQMMGYIKHAYYIFIKKIKYVGVLNLVNYDKEAAIKLKLISEQDFDDLISPESVCRLGN